MKQNAITISMIKNNNIVDNDVDYAGEQRMTSIEIAELTGKQHNDLMKAIRKMEPAWEKISQGKFSLSCAFRLPFCLFPCVLLTDFFAIRKTQIQEHLYSREVLANRSKIRSS